MTSRPPQQPDRAAAAAERRGRIRRQRIIAASAVGVLVIGGIVGAVVATSGGDDPNTPSGAKATDMAMATTSAATPRPPATHVSAPAAPTSSVLRGRASGSLPAPLQDPALADLGGGRVMLIGGLDSADMSTNEIRLVTGSRTTVIGHLPLAMHDAAAVAIGGKAYLFGGGDGSAQHDEIDVIDPATGTPHQVGTLPSATSDQSAAVVDGTAYVVGGFDGSRWLDTIVAWKPGGTPRVVGHLPYAVRYAATAAAGGKIIIAGGTTSSAATDTVLEYTPGKGVTTIGHLPAATTHAAAAALGSSVVIIGGRGNASGTPTSRLVSVDPATGTIRSAGSLGVALSDLVAAPSRTGLRTYGGRTASATVAAIRALVPVGQRPATATVAAAAVTDAPARGNVYSQDSAGNIMGAARTAKYLIYVPNSESNTLNVVNPRTYKVIARYPVGRLPQHVVPAWDLKTLYVTNDLGNSLTPIDPTTGKPKGHDLPVDDPYNMYFMPDGSSAIVVAERFARLDFRNPHTMRLKRSLSVPCTGVDHMDFAVDGSYLLASCEFSGQVVKVSLTGLPKVVGSLTLGSSKSMPQDVKVSPDGRTFYVADMQSNGVWKVDAKRFRVKGFLATGKGAHGLYPSRDARDMYVSNRGEGTISVVSFRTGRVVRVWHIPGGGSPDMGGVSPDGKVLWLSGRYNGVLYAISTINGHLLARIPVGSGPHGVAVWPQPGPHSLGHTGIMR
jgi:YVTN family beta-propeller protein